jgi:formyl-CoA transferase/CoA:oxalate CoA-transferase
MEWPLKGVKVLDLSQNVAGPYAGMILAEFGAQVVKIESPGGDPTKTWGPPFWNELSPTYLALNRNKTAVKLDLKTIEGKSKLLRMLEKADVLLISSRPTAVESMGLTYDDLSKSFPALIYGEISAFGHEGPRAAQPGYDPLMQALSGIMSVTGHESQPPVRVGVSVVDMAAGMWLALGMVLALRMRERSGRGHLVTVSQYETAISWMTYHIEGYLSDGKVPRRWGSGAAMIAPYEAFPTKDGWIVIAAGNDKLFRRLCVALGRPEWATDRKYLNNKDRVENRENLRRRIARVTLTRASLFWEKKLGAAEIPVAPIMGLDAVLADKQLKVSGMIQSMFHPKIQGFKSVGLPLLIDGKRPPLSIPPPVQ